MPCLCRKAKSGKTDDRSKTVKGRYKKKFDIVLVRKFDRLSREKAHIALARIYQLLDMGIKIVSIHEPFDLQTPAGELALTNSIGYNRFFSRNLGSEIPSGLITTLKRGFWRCGEPPYGWKCAKVFDEAIRVYRTKLEINEKEAKAVR
ncbi:MAG: recombinase family protein [Candidatus Riflebacteria bacterium]|nr:recombinase family protein [Candidatus Riflebacteria bacterium]